MARSANADSIRSFKEQLYFEIIGLWIKAFVHVLFDSAASYLFLGIKHDQNLVVSF